MSHTNAAMYIQNTIITMLHASCDMGSVCLQPSPRFTPLSWKVLKTSVCTTSTCMEGKQIHIISFIFTGYEIIQYKPICKLTLRMLLSCEVRVSRLAFSCSSSMLRFNNRRFSSSFPATPNTAQYQTPVSTNHRSVPNTGQYQSPVSTNHRSVPNTGQYQSPVSTNHRSVPNTGQYQTPVSTNHRSVPTTGGWY